MIYDIVDASAPIRQGDIFLDIPHIAFDLNAISEVTDENILDSTWRDLLRKGKRHSIIVGVQAVAGIVLSQDCDCCRSENLALARIIPYSEALGSSNPPSTPKKWSSAITRLMRTNPRYFYLPLSDKIAIESRSAVDLRDIVVVARTKLEVHKDLRIGRLNQDAYEHFQRTVGNFFTRYPVNEWYVLDKDELLEYSKDNEGVNPYPWQL